MSNSAGLVVSLAEMEQFYRGDKAGQIIELMNKTNDIMDDVLWMESNQSDGHLTRIRTGLPEVYWRRLYQGTPPSKSQWSQVKEGCGILEAIMELDVEELRLYGSRDKAFRMSEGVAFAEAMRQKVATTLFYGNSNINPDEFNGLSMRYPAQDAKNVLDAGGRDADGCTSLWLISWGAQSVRHAHSTIQPCRRSRRPHIGRSSLFRLRRRRRPVPHGGLPHVVCEPAPRRP